MSFKIVQKKSLPGIPRDVIASVISKFQQGNQAGLAVGEANVNVLNVNAGTFVHDRKTNDLRIISPRFLPALGGELATRCLSQSLEQLYNAIAGSAYDTTSFNRADLGKHLFITEGFVLAMDMIDRYLDTFAIRQYGNLAPDMLLSAQRFSKYHGGNPVDYPTLQALRNELVPLFDKLLIPSSIGWINKHRSLVRHVYADDIHEKTQFIVPVPEYLYVQLDTADNVDVMSISYWNAKGSSPKLDIINFAQALITYVQNYLDSAWFKDLSPYLWRAMCQSNGPKIDTPIKFERRDEVCPKLDLDIIFDYNVIQLVRNADYIGVPANIRSDSTAGNYGTLKIFEDNEGNLRQGDFAVGSGLGTYGIAVAPIMVVYTNGHTITTTEQADNVGSLTLLRDTDLKCAVFPTNSDFKYVNAEDFPSSDETLYYLTNASVRLGSHTVSGSPGEMRIIYTCGDTIFTMMNLYFNYLPYGSEAVEEFIPYEFATLSRIAINTLGAVSESTFAITVGNISIVHEDIMSLVEALNCCPLIGMIYIDQSNQIASKVKYVDKDNLVHIPNAALRYAHEYIMYHAMELGSASKVSYDSGNKKTNQKRNSKSKGKQTPEDKDK